MSTLQPKNKAKFEPKSNITTLLIGEEFGHSNIVAYDGTIIFPRGILGGISLDNVKIAVVLFVGSATFTKTDTGTATEISMTGTLQLSDAEFNFTLTRVGNESEWNITLIDPQLVMITKPDQCKIRAQEIDIPADGQLGNFEEEGTRIAAASLVEYLRTKLGGWSEFTQEGLFQFYQERSWGNEGMLHGLYGDLSGAKADPGDRYIVFVNQHPTNIYLSTLAVTEEFILKCIKS
jgi:hypothetical protein